MTTHKFDVIVTTSNSGSIIGRNEECVIPDGICSSPEFRMNIKVFLSEMLGKCFCNVIDGYKNLP